MIHSCIDFYAKLFFVHCHRHLWSKSLNHFCCFRWNDENVTKILFILYIKISYNLKCTISTKTKTRFFVIYLIIKLFDMDWNFFHLAKTREMECKVFLCKVAKVFCNSKKPWKLRGPSHGIFCWMHSFKKLWMEFIYTFQNIYIIHRCIHTERNTR